MVLHWFYYESHISDAFGSDDPFSRSMAVGGSSLSTAASLKFSDAVGLKVLQICLLVFHFFLFIITFRMIPTLILCHH